MINKKTWMIITVTVLISLEVFIPTFLYVFEYIPNHEILDFVVPLTIIILVIGTLISTEYLSYD